MGRLLFLLLLFPFCTVSSQTFTQRIQQDVSGQGRVTIHQDEAITELVNGKPATTVATPPRTTTQRQQAQRPAGNDVSSNDTDTQATDSLTQTTPRRTKKAAGYRVQPFVGGKTRADRVKAEQTGNALQTLFPAHRVYVHFLGGRWTCRLGDFQTIAEAKEVLDEVVRLGYDRAIMVRGTINVPY